MNQFLTLNFAFILVAVLFVCTIYALIYAVKVNARLSQSVKLINDLYKLSQEQGIQLNKLKKQQDQDKLMQDANHSQSSEVNVEALKQLQAQVTSIEHSLNKVADKTEQLQHTDPEVKMYTKANQLADSGASIEDIVEACGLPRAEVEIMMGLKRKKIT